MYGRLALLILSGGTVGCADDQNIDEGLHDAAEARAWCQRRAITSDERDDLSFSAKKCGQGKPDAGIEELPADAPGIETIRAHGTGCSGGWHAALTGDRMGVHVGYSSFESKVQQDRLIDTRNCVHAISLRNMDKFRYSVTSSVRGFAFLVKGQSAKVVQRVSISGNLNDHTASVLELVGPVDEYFKHDALLSKTVTACGAAQGLDFTTTVRVESTSMNTSFGGFANLSANEGPWESGQLITVTATPCE